MMLEEVSLHSARGQLLMWHRRTRRFTLDRLGLETVPARYVMCSREDMLANYICAGMPIHVPHWTNGKAYAIQRSQKDALEDLAYEMVINSDPSFVYHLDDNDVPLNAMICAHVQGHLWFFKHNVNYRDTDPAGLLLRLREARDRIEGYRRDPAIGRRKVDEAIEAARALSPHSGILLPQTPDITEAEERLRLEGRLDDVKYGLLRETSEWNRKQLVEEKEEIERRLRHRPLQRSDDLLAFLMDRELNPHLADWTRDVFEIVHAEARYFLALGCTKNMNEGFASFVHRRAILEPEWMRASAMYAPRFARLNAAFEQTYSGVYFTPYSFCYKMFENIYEKTRRPDHEPEVEIDLERLEHHPDAAPGEEYYLFPTGETERVTTRMLDLEGVLDAARRYDDPNFFREFCTDELLTKINLEQLERVKQWMWRINIQIPASGFDRRLVADPLPDTLEGLLDVLEIWINEAIATERARREIGTPRFPALLPIMKDVVTALQVMAAFENNKEVAKNRLLLRNCFVLHIPKVWAIDVSDGVLTLVHDYDPIFGPLHEQEAADVLRYVKNNWSGTKVRLVTKKAKLSTKPEEVSDYEIVCNEKGEISKKFL